jgi:hypothetical protein
MPTPTLLLAHVHVLVLALAATAPQKPAVVWTPRWDDAFADAAQNKKVVFLALNMDGEAANDRMVSKVYTDPRIVAASKLTVNLPASRFEHAADGKPCARFGPLTCLEHRRIEGAARDNVLKTDAAGYTVAPQHIFLSGDGKVLLSVPYEVSAQELEWCFHEALAAVDPEAAKKIAVSGRAPRRLIQGGVFDPSAIPGANLAPPTREEVLAIVKEMRASMWSASRLQNIQRLLLSSEPEAIEQIEGELKNELFGRRGWLQGAPGGAGGPDAAQLGDYKDRLMHGIGVLSPTAYWKLVASYLEHAEEELRHEAIVALEQLAAPESVSAITKAISKEKVPALRKDLYRALGSAGAGDEKARKTLLKALTTEKDELARRNALFALGWLAPAAESDKVLEDVLAKGTAEERSAAGLAAALTRNEAWLERVRLAEGAEENPEVKECLAAALGVLQGAGLTTLRPLVRKICGDEIEREKLFGVAQG